MAKEYVSVRLDKELLGWVDNLVKRKMFGSRTHAVEYALAYLKSVYEKEGRLPPIE